MLRVANVTAVSTVNTNHDALNLQCNEEDIHLPSANGKAMHNYVLNAWSTLEILIILMNILCRIKIVQEV